LWKDIGVFQQLAKKEIRRLKRRIAVEGNECYKFSTIRNFIEISHIKDIEIILDIGVNMGDISLMMNIYFPMAKIYGFESVKEYYEIAYVRTKHINNIRLSNKAVSSQHIFMDDIGEYPREKSVALKILKGIPEAGPGWLGGSVVLPEDHELIANTRRVFGFERIDQEVLPITLKELMHSEKIEEIDLIKIDCEGCEHSCLGCADMDTLKRIRFITGEYHDIKRFYTVLHRKLFLTHKVNLIGTRVMGCFFAERLDGGNDGILKFNKTGMLVPRPWLCEFPIDWHIFNEKFVLEQERYWHALP
jgi:FkbM family methyltransferase